MTTAVLTLFSACTSDDRVLQEDERVPITITAAISPTRSTTTQDVAIRTGESVYLWAFKQSGSSADYSYSNLYQEWTTTVDASGALTSAFQYYYPPEKLTMVGLHGNFGVFSYMSTPVTHTVFADQSTLANYAKSDLLHWTANGITSSSSPISATFNHKLCKIVVVLESNLYSDADLNNAEVTLNGVQPTISITPQTGALSSLDGTATTIKPYKSDNIHREAIIPPQDKPAGFITVTMNGYTTSATPDLPATSFDSNTKYVYTITVNKTGITLKTSIEAWGNTPDNNSTLSPGLSSRNVKMNPLWYMAKSNLNQDASSFSIVNNINQGYLWVWGEAMAKGYSAKTTTYNGYDTPATPKTVYNGESGTTWHMPTRMEWYSIIPFTSNIFSSDVAAGTIVNEEACTFGYDNDTKFGEGNTSNPASPSGKSFKSYWSSYTANSNERYAIRFLGTDYCSVWRYKLYNMGSGNTTARLVISSRLIEPIEDTNTLALAAMMNTITDSEYDWTEDESKGAVERVLYACGANNGSSSALPGSHYSGTIGLYWCSTDVDNTYVWNLYFAVNYLWIYSTTQYKSYARTVRLFRDNPEKDVWKNPLWYVAEKNVKYTQASGTFNGSGSFSFETADNAGFLFGWTTALKYFTTTSNRSAATPSPYDGYKKGTGCVISGWHLPSASEISSIFPGYFRGFANEGSIFENKEYIYKSNLVTANFGCNYETKTIGVIDNSYWHKVSNIEIHAIRFLGTPYCSAWKYQWTTSPTASTLIISATLIDPVANDATGLAAEIWYNNYWPQVYFGNDPSKGAVQRTFSGIGSNSNSNEPTKNSGNFVIYYWTSSSDEDGNRIGLDCVNNMETGFSDRGGWWLYHYPVDYAGGFPVRLFLDN